MHVLLTHTYFLPINYLSYREVKSAFHPLLFDKTACCVMVICPLRSSTSDFGNSLVTLTLPTLNCPVPVSSLCSAVASLHGSALFDSIHRWGGALAPFVILADSVTILHV